MRKSFKSFKIFTDKLNVRLTKLPSLKSVSWNCSTRGLLTVFKPKGKLKTKIVAILVYFKVESKSFG
ncbi:MAG: hypothetical protein AMR96_02300 [Candidatus Adiutrix intracellularis]|nr:MAG: hypothetical protein AMR96_02300 [Candidatus Adiutrix intracellularis]